jgi:sec-independent protein translocase protein TatA
MMVVVDYSSNKAMRFRSADVVAPDPGAEGKMMFGLGMTEFVLILAVVLFVFGWGRLPQLGNNVRQAIRNCKQMMQGGDEIDVTPTAADNPERKESRHVRERGG